MIDPEDIKKLEQWTLKQDTNPELHTWYVKICLELIQYIRYLELELSRTKIRNADLDEELRLLR